NENYLLSYHPRSNTIHTLYHSDAESNDVIKSILHSLRFHDIVSRGETKVDDLNTEEATQHIKESMRVSHEWTNEKFGNFVAELDDKDWQSDVIFWLDRGFRVKWERSKDKEKTI
ncbi:5343_t:CDS:2, partial [Acaulospora colombiana]